MAPTEQWRPIPGFPGYEVSSLGRVLSHRRRSARILRGSVGLDGYRSTGLYREGKLSIHKTHRLVAEAFLGPRPDGMQTRHLDGHKLNNRLDNLAYGTASQNAKDTIQHGRHHLTNKTHCPAKHPYDEANTYQYKNHRQCRACKRQYDIDKALRAAGIEVAA